MQSMTTIGNRGLRRVIDGALALLVVAVIGCIGLGVVPPRLGHPTLVIRGGSMEPTIPLGSLVLLNDVGPGGSRVGDVVSYSVGNAATVTHRITRVEIVDGVRFVETKGDANPDTDPVLIPDSAIRGVVAVSLPGVGFVISFLATRLGLLAVILVGLTLVMLAMTLESFSGSSRPNPRTMPGLGLDAT